MSSYFSNSNNRRKQNQVNLSFASNSVSQVNLPDINSSAPIIDINNGGRVNSSQTPLKQNEQNELTIENYRTADQESTERMSLSKNQNLIINNRSDLSSRNNSMPVSNPILGGVNNRYSRGSQKNILGSYDDYDQDKKSTKQILLKSSNLSFINSQQRLGGNPYMKNLKTLKGINYNFKKKNKWIQPVTQSGIQSIDRSHIPNPAPLSHRDSREETPENDQELTVAL